MRKKIILPLISILLAAAVLLAAYNLLSGLRLSNAQAELEEKMRTILPGSASFTEEAYTGEDANIQCIYKGETGYVIGTRTAGYADDIAMLIGVSKEGDRKSTRLNSSHP